MTSEANDRISIARAEVQRLFGECVLRLQGYERLMKAILTQHRRSGSAVTFGEPSTNRDADIHRQTLGILVGRMLNDFIVTDGPQEPGNPSNDDPEFEICMWIGLRPENRAKVEADLRDLVTLRNRLVHNFFDDHELSSPGGCEEALSALNEALERIAIARDQLRDWAADLEGMQSSLAELLNSPDIQNALIGGAIPWPITTVVKALREAEVALAAEGWAPVLEAEKWMSNHYPDEQPAGYGCRSWRQVIHDSGLFDLSYRVVDGRREARFRTNPRTRSVQ